MEKNPAMNVFKLLEGKEVTNPDLPWGLISNPNSVYNSSSFIVYYCPFSEGFV